MNYSIIEKIFFGERGQVENMVISEKHKRLDSECIRLYDGLKKTLNDEQKEQLDTLLNKNSDADAETAINYYKEGFKIGLLLLSECLQ